MATGERDRYLLVSGNAVSGRSALVADEGDSVWLYLTKPGDSKISADCWLFNRVAAPNPEELSTKAADYRARGEPPPATSDVVDERARLSGELDDTRVRVFWSTDGE